MMGTIILLFTHGIWISSFFLLYWQETGEKGNRVFTVTVPKEHRQQENVQKIRWNFRKKMKWYGILFSISAVYYFSPLPYKWWYLGLICALSMIIPEQWAKRARNAMRKIKKEEKWPSISMSQKRYTDIKLERSNVNKKISWQYFLIPGGIHLGHWGGIFIRMDI